MNHVIFRYRDMRVSQRQTVTMPVRGFGMDVKGPKPVRKHTQISVFCTAERWQHQSQLQEQRSGGITCFSKQIQIRSGQGNHVTLSSIHGKLHFTRPNDEGASDAFQINGEQVLHLSVHHINTTPRSSLTTCRAIRIHQHREQ